MMFARSDTKCRRPFKGAAIFLFCAIAVGMPAHSRGYQQYGVQVGSRTIKLKWNRMPVQYFIENVGVPMG